MNNFGAKYETFRDFLVAGGTEAPAVPLVLVVESGSVRVGETARFLATSGLEGQPMLLERFRAGRLLSRSLLKAGEEKTVVEIPVTEEDRGGFGITLSALRDHPVDEPDDRGLRSLGRPRAEAGVRHVPRQDPARDARDVARRR